MIRKLLATTAITALVASGAYAQTPDTEQQDQQQVQAQDQQQQQAQQEITVSDGDTVIIEADGEETDVHLRIQAAVDAQPAEQQVQQDMEQDDAQQQAAEQPDQQQEQADQQAQADQQQDQQVGVRERQDLQAADMQQISADDLIGTEVYSGQDEHVGNVNDVLLTQDGEVDAIIVDVGGFLGMGAREVAFGMEELELMADADGNVYVYSPFTQEQLEGAPEYDQATWEEQRDDQRLTGEMAQAQVDQQQEQADQQAQVDEQEEQVDQQAQVDQQEQADDQAMAEQQPGEMGEHVVMAGGTVIVQADQDSFQLNFQVRQAGETDEMAAAPAEDDQEMAAAPAEPDPETTAAIDQERTQVDAQEVRADDLIGSTLYGANDENVGTVGDIILTEDGSFDAVIVDVGGFLGIGAREVALGLDEVQFMQDQQGNWYIYTQYTEEQLEAAPEYDPATYAEQRDEQRVGVQRQ